jgi:hypothetical protein
MWRDIQEFPYEGWVFVYFDDGIEYGWAEYDGLMIGNELFDVLEAKAWCVAPTPNELL